MSIKLNGALLTATTLVLSTLAPALAQSTPDILSVDKTKVDIAQSQPQQREGRIEHRSHFRGMAAWGEKSKGCAHGKACARGTHEHSRFAKLTGENALSDQQLEQLFNVQSRFFDQLGPKLGALFSEKREMRDLLTQPSLDKAKVEALQASIDKTSNEIADLKLDEKLNSISVLTDAQRKVIREAYVKHAVFSNRMGMRV